MYLRGKRVGALSFILHQTPQNRPDLNGELPLHILNAGPLVSACYSGLDLGVLGVYQARNWAVATSMVVPLPTICL